MNAADFTQWVFSWAFNLALLIIGIALLAVFTTRITAWAYRQVRKTLDGKPEEDEEKPGKYHARASLEVGPNR